MDVIFDCLLCETLTILPFLLAADKCDIEI